MSLINEALKKAQRRRTEAAADVAPVPGGGRIAKRGRAQSANTILLLGGAALGLVVLSVVATVYLLNRGAEAPARIAAGAPTQKAAAADDSPILIVPGLPGPASPLPTEVSKTTAPVAVPDNSPPPVDMRTAAAEPSRASPTSESARGVPSSTPAVPPGSVASAPAELVALPPAVELAKPDERIYQYVDALRIMGVKAAGPDSRVLMNDRVYRLNDIVERTLGVRLLKVEPNTLTFSDANGAIYLKNF